MTAILAPASAADAMVRVPTLHGRGLTVGDCRAAFSDDHQHMLLIVEAGGLLGTLVRGDVPADAPATAPALPFATTTGRTVGPAEPLEPLRVSMVAAGVRRLVVVDDQASVLGLLCLKGRLDGFCSDADVAARRADDLGCR